MQIDHFLADSTCGVIFPSSTCGVKVESLNRIKNEIIFLLHLGDFNLNWWKCASICQLFFGIICCKHNFKVLQDARKNCEDYIV